VPFLTSDALLAWTWGRGDRLLPLPPLPRMAVTLVTFPDGVHTGAAYAAFSAQHGTAPGTPQAGAPYPGAMAYPADAFSSWASVASLAVNDFEQVVPDQHAGVAVWLPVVTSAAEVLRATGAPAIGRLSGSGATCFLLHPPDHGLALADTARDAPAHGARLVTTHTAATIVAPEPIL